jgi:hypothetical protein
MDTHSKDLLYGDQSPAPSHGMLSDDASHTDEDAASISGSDLGQGSGEEHISFKKEDEEESEKKRVGGRMGGDEEPTKVLDEFGNSLPQAEKEDDGAVSII